MGRELLDFGAAVDLEPSKGILEIGAPRQHVLHAGRALDVVQPALREKDEPQAIQVSARERERTG